MEADNSQDVRRIPRVGGGEENERKFIEAVDLLAEKLRQTIGFGYGRAWVYVHVDDHKLTVKQSGSQENHK